MKNMKNRYGCKTYTLLTTNNLLELDFKDKGQCTFELFEGMNYWVKNGICLFYNVPINKYDCNSFYVGYAEMRQGKHVAVGFRWIDTVEELTQIYESIIQKSITEPI